MPAVGNEEVLLESSDSTPQTHVHDLVQVFDDDSDTENDLSLEEGENWLRLVDRSHTTGNLALDNTQDMTPERARLPYPVLLQLGSIDAPTDDCFICFDVDGPLVAIKDMRNPFASNDEEEEGNDESLKIYLARRKSIKKEVSVDDNNTAMEGDNSILETDTAYKNSTGQMWRNYGGFEVLPRRQLRVLQNGDRICTRLTTTTTVAGGAVKDRDIGLVLEYRYSDSPARTTTQNGFGAGAAIAAEPSDEEKEDDEYVLTQPISEEDGEIAEHDEPPVLPGQESESSDHDEEDNKNGDGKPKGSSPEADRKEDAVDSTSDNVPEKILGSQFEVLRKIAGALPYVPTATSRQEENVEASIEQNSSHDEETANIVAVTSEATGLTLEGSDETTKLVPILTTQPGINDKKVESDDETTLNHQSEIESVVVEIAYVQHKGLLSNATDLDDRTETLPDSEPCSLDAPTQQVFGPLPPPARTYQDDCDTKEQPSGTHEPMPSRDPPIVVDVAIPEKLVECKEVDQHSVPDSITAQKNDIPTNSCQEGASVLFSLLHQNINDQQAHNMPPSVCDATCHDSNVADERPDACLLQPKEKTAEAPIAASAPSVPCATDIVCDKGTLAHSKSQSKRYEVKQPNKCDNEGADDDSHTTVGIEVPVPEAAEDDSQMTVAMDNDLAVDQEATVNRLPPIPEMSTGEAEAKAANSDSKEPASQKSACKDAAETTGQQGDKHSNNMVFDPTSNTETKKERYRKSYAVSGTKGRTRRNTKSSEPSSERVKDDVFDNAAQAAVATAVQNDPPTENKAVELLSGLVTRPETNHDDETKGESIASPVSQDSSLKSRTSKRSRQSPASQSTSKRARVRAPSNKSSQQKSPPPSDSADIRVVATNVHLTPSQKKMIERIGGVLLDDVHDAVKATHVIAAEGKAETNEDDEPSFKRTSKLMIGICCTENVVHLDWLIKSAKAKKILSVHEFLLLKDRAAEKRYNFNMRESLLRRKEMRMSDKTLLGGWGVYVCHGVANNKAPPENELKLIVEAAGGTWLACPGDHQISHTLIITSDPETKKQTSAKAVSTVLKQGARKYPVSWLFDCIMTQQLTLK